LAAFLGNYVIMDADENALVGFNCFPVTKSRRLFPELSVKVLLVYFRSFVSVATLAHPFSILCHHSWFPMEWKGFVNKKIKSQVSFVSILVRDLGPNRRFIKSVPGR
jgi:hypothetical protein